jgi:DNA-binding transcriptional ArsR family regulator
MLSIQQAANGFAAAGSESRLTVLLSLVRAGPAGLTIGQIIDKVGLPASTLAHHLNYLDNGGLIKQQKQGRAVINRANYQVIEALADFLLKECCADSEN